MDVVHVCCAIHSSVSPHTAAGNYRKKCINTFAFVVSANNIALTNILYFNYEHYFEHHLFMDNSRANKGS